MSEPPIGGDRNRGPGLVAIFWTECAVAITVVGLRLYGRKMIHSFGSDDYMMLFALALFITSTSFVTYLASMGGCRHLYYMTPAEKLKAVKFNWITQAWGVVGFAAGKNSVALQIKRILSPNDRRMNWLLWFIMVSTTVFSGLTCVTGFVQCSPHRALWDHSIPHSKCWDSSVGVDIGIFISCWNVMVDLVLAAIPIPIIWRTSLSTKKRIATCVLLGLGPLAAAFGIVKIPYIASLTARSDLTWETYDLYVWTGSELFVIIFCGCIPPMRPIFTKIFRSKNSLFKGYDDSCKPIKRHNPLFSLFGSSVKSKSQIYQENTEALHSNISNIEAGSGTHHLQMPSDSANHGEFHIEVDDGVLPHK